MLDGAFGNGKSNSLLGEYSALLGDAVLRHRTRTAEHSARIEAELASRVKSEFIANMSHKLRTPLNTVIGFSKLLTEHERRQLPDSEIVQYARLINDAADHLLAVINDILDISKMQSGRSTLDSREIMLDEVLEAIIATFKLQSTESQIKLTCDVPPDLPPIRGDEVKLRQIFTNIISNALKFTRSGGAVTIDACQSDDGGLRIIVADTGIGMTADEIHVALTPFGQVDGSRARWREGTGLGLPIARALVELHGGWLEITSEPSMGTTVTVTLPSRHDVRVAGEQGEVLDQATLANQNLSA